MLPHSNREAALYALRIYEKGFDIDYLARQMGLTVEQAQEDIDWAVEESHKEHRKEREKAN